MEDTDSPRGKQKGKTLKRKSSASPVSTTPKSRKKGESGKTPTRPIIHPRFREGGGGSDHQVKLLPQPSTPIDLDLQVKQEKSVPTNAYTCQLCNFSTARLNVLVLHQKSHSEPAKMPVANNRGVSSKPKASPSPHQPTTKKKQEQSNGNKSKSSNSTTKKIKEPSDAPKSSPKTVAKKSAKS